ncbi:tRNA 2-thiouridine(34) synthase MnmA [uncultured Clostridium sp.]|uniref:tRNA 2-thiouridine(34) synthase MnmA n=1 Tax=uncultured Clostridium sp. TaxID=59620 RepID=UPI0028F0E9E2|nr:tRNA 2-thiouridine(34) synthase MnmA [uncultured Clostridium sp.]
MKKKVFVGMSGGVDSSVTAHLLKKQGYEVVGMTMKVFPGNKCNNGLTESEMIIENARKVCEDLNIEFVAVDLIEEFNDKVVNYFMNEYVNGRTPNPCVQCNKYIKFDVFLKKALELGADYIATGHYSKVKKVEDRYLIYKGDDERKDQSYMFYNLQQHQLKHVLMPCGDYTKPQIREIAKEIGLEVHNKKDSEEICFIPDNNHGRFIVENYKGNIPEGEFVDKNGNVLGKHKGLIHYTIGQRKGLGIALGKPAFVIDIIPSKNQVVIGEEEEIFKRELIAKDFNFIPFDKLENKMRVEAKIRYAAKPSPATIEIFDGNKLKVIFDEPQRAITKGQSVVFYLENLLLGGGIIDSIS